MLISTVISFRFCEQLRFWVPFLVPFLLKTRSHFGPLSEYFGSPFGTVPHPHISWLHYMNVHLNNVKVGLWKLPTPCSVLHPILYLVIGLIQHPWEVLTYDHAHHHQDRTHWSMNMHDYQEEPPPPASMTSLLAPEPLSSGAALAAWEWVTLFVLRGLF